MSEHDEGLVERVAMAIDPVAWLHGEVQGHLLNQARAAIRVLAPELRHDPPEGCEWVALPVETVDEWAGMPTTDYPPSLHANRSTVEACRDAVARRPKPEHRTERVPAVQALGRDVVSDEGSRSPTFIGSSIVRWVYDGLAVQSYSGRSQQRIAPDGTVEVLAEDGAE